LTIAPSATTIKCPARFLFSLLLFYYTAVG